MDDVLAWFGGRQHGVVAREQLLDAGVPADVIDRRLRSRALHPLHRGIYAVGHTDLPRYGRETAALLFCGPGSVLSHVTAAVVVEIARDDGGPIHVTTNGRNRRGTAGIVVHRATAESVVRHGLPTTTPTRTLLDLAAIDHPQLPEAVNEALVLERDRARDQGHAAAGLRVMRVTWRQLADRPEAVVAHLAKAL